MIKSQNDFSTPHIQLTLQWYHKILEDLIKKSPELHRGYSKLPGKSKKQTQTTVDKGIVRHPGGLDTHLGDGGEHVIHCHRANPSLLLGHLQNERSQTNAIRLRCRYSKTSECGNYAACNKCQFTTKPKIAFEQQTGLIKSRHFAHILSYLQDICAARTKNSSTIYRIFRLILSEEERQAQRGAGTSPGRCGLKQMLTWHDPKQFAIAPGPTSLL